MIDSHTHVHLAGYMDLENMAIAGIEKLVSCTVGSPTTVKGLFDEANNILNVYRKNAKANGIELYAAVGMHPLNIPPDWRDGIHIIEEFLSMENVVAIGEVGINSDRSIEVDVFREMLNLAKRYDKPVIVHTPFKDRKEIVRKEIDVIEGVGISPDLVVIDHINTDVIDMVKEKGLHYGLTVREGRLKPEDVYKNIEIFEDGMLNSDLINTGPSDALSVPKTVKYLRANGVRGDIIRKISFENARRFFGKI